jgi:pyruvate carboxylase
MAQFMIANSLTAVDVMERGDQISFPESVQQFFMGDIGQPTGGFPKALQRIILKDKTPFTEPPGKLLPAVDFDYEFEAFKKRFEKAQAFTDYLSWKFFPKVFEEYYEKLDNYGDVTKIPTKHFFFGLNNREETIIEIGKGQAIVVKLLGVGPPEDGGLRTVFYNLNGQTRNLKVTDKSLNVIKLENRKAEPGDATQIPAPLQGMLSKVFVKEGQSVKRNEPLFVIEAMKMETTVTAPADLTIKSVVLKDKTLVNGGDLVIIVAE